MFICNAQTSIALYVSTHGNDGWRGNLPKANAQRSNGPLRSIERALQLVKDSFQNAQVVEIVFRKGDYNFRKGIVIDRVIKPGSNKLIIRSHTDELVTFSGSVPLGNFKKITGVRIKKRLAPGIAGSVFQASIKDYDSNSFNPITNRGTPGAELFFNNERMQLARWPDTGWVHIKDVPQTGTLVNEGNKYNQRYDNINTGRHYGRFKYSERNPSLWSDIKNISLYGYWVHDWYDEFLSVEKIDTTAKEFYIKKPHSLYGYSRSQRYYALNAIEELNQPGEWVIDRSDQIIYFYPPAELRPNTCFLSVLQEPFIQFPDVENVTLQGIQFSYSQSTAIVIKDGRNNLVEGCKFRYVGDIAVKVLGGEKNGVSSCDFTNISGGGITLAGGDRATLKSAGNFATNNHLHHFGQWLKTNQSAITISGVGNIISHNLIHNGPNSGITLHGNEHIIEYNDLHTLAQETEDVGAFYMGRDWTQRGNIIRYNYFHDLMGYTRHDANAVYLDDFTSDVKVIGNIFYKCAMAVQIGGGRDNLVDNNFFYDCLTAVSVDSRGTGWAKNYFSGGNNILFERMDKMNYTKPPYSIRYPQLLKYYADSPAIAKNNVLINNISLKTRWVLLLDRLNFTVVESRNNVVQKQTEKDSVGRNDIVIKENLKITRERDGRFKIPDEFYRHGFQPLPYEKIGLYKNRFRREPLKSFP